MGDHYLDGTVAELRRFVDHAEAICKDRGWPPDETPACVGYIPLRREELPPEVLEEMREWRRQVVKDYEERNRGGAG